MTHRPCPPGACQPDGRPSELSGQVSSGNGTDGTAGRGGSFDKAAGSERGAVASRLNDRSLVRLEIGDPAYLLRQPERDEMTDNREGLLAALVCERSRIKQSQADAREEMRAVLAEIDEQISRLAAEIESGQQALPLEGGE